MTIYDRLYGPMEFSEAEVRLFRTPELARLREVSLSAVPPWMIPTSTAATKLEHSLGVAHLTRLLNKNTIPLSGDDQQNLFFAALVHDVGTPPFSHLTERFLRQITRCRHEEYAAMVLDGSALAKEIHRQGGSLERILGYITGKNTPLGHLINGPLDLDTLDNSLRYGVSMGLLRTLVPTVQDLDRIYSPGAIATALALHNDAIVVHGLVQDELKKWVACREAVYEYVYSAANLGPGSMLYRAIGFAVEAGEITETFFRLTDSAACRFLEEQCNPRTRQLVEQARRWQWHIPVFTLSEQQLSVRLRATLQSASTRIALADHLAKALGLPPEDVVTYTGKTRTSKTLPPVLNEGVLGPPPVMQDPQWLVSIFVAPQHAHRGKEIAASAEEFLQLPSTL